jgi:putative tryptophan/tyrosine transport system ATP-binding protein
MLRIESLSQVFNIGSANEVHALRDIDLYLPAEQFTTLIGSNGAGKTTLFNVIAGVFPPSHGRIEIDGIDVSGWPEHRRGTIVGRVFQDPLMGTAASMTIAQNLTLALLRNQRLRLRTGVTKDRRELFLEFLVPLELGLEDRLDVRVSMLSGGQRQAMTLLMASLARPKVLLLDEHTTALDPGTAIKILELTKKIIQDQRITTLMITHNMQQALDTGDRTLMMDRGRIILDLSAEDKSGLVVQDLVEKFKEVKHERLYDDELLLSA